MLTLYGRRNSINVQKALWALGELGLSYDHVDAGGEAGGLDAPAFRAMNPHGKVPVLTDGDAAIWESNVIVRYLCATYAPGVLCPTGPAERAQFEAWIDWEQTTLQPAIMGYFWGYYRTPAELRDAARNRECEEAAGAAIRILDGWLQHRPFLAGEAFSMADIPAGTLMFRYYAIEIERPEAPAVGAWRARLEARAPYREHVMRPFGELFGRLAY